MFADNYCLINCFIFPGYELYSHSYQLEINKCVFLITYLRLVMFICKSNITVDVKYMTNIFQLIISVQKTKINIIFLLKRFMIIIIPFI